MEGLWGVWGCPGGVWGDLGGAQGGSGGVYGVLGDLGWFGVRTRRVLGENWGAQAEIWECLARAQAAPEHPCPCPALQTAPKWALCCSGRHLGNSKASESNCSTALPIPMNSCASLGNGKIPKDSEPSTPQAAPLPALLLTKHQTIEPFSLLAPGQLVPSSPPSFINWNIFHSYAQCRIELESNPD